MMNPAQRSVRLPQSLSLLSVLILAGCPAGVTVDLQPGSTVESLSFSVSRGENGEPTELPVFLIDSCKANFSNSDDRYWGIEPGLRPRRVKEIRYGVLPDGYRTVVEARALIPATCYVAVYGGADALYFTSDAEGNLREISQESARRLVSG